MMINNQLDFLFDHTLTSLRTAAVAQWVRAFVGDGGGYICLCKMCDMLVFHMMKTLQICGLYVDVFNQEEIQIVIKNDFQIIRINEYYFGTKY